MKNTSKIQKDCMDLSCTLSMIGGKYICSILYLLANREESIRFNELRHNMGDIPCKTLSNTLKKMESCELLLRTEFPQIPPKVEYCLTKKGAALLPVLQAMCDWRTQHVSGV